mmetsp:Transcript_13970/g.30283  ORF Transcript_13970/g.30283 Transcript_13970/m.30283 type:complete len:219 (+) Transcript_13970:364-1020(+)
MVLGTPFDPYLQPWFEKEPTRWAGIGGGSAALHLLSNLPLSSGEGNSEPREDIDREAVLRALFPVEAEELCFSGGGGVTTPLDFAAAVPAAQPGLEMPQSLRSSSDPSSGRSHPLGPARGAGSVGAAACADSAAAAWGLSARWISSVCGTESVPSDVSMVVESSSSVSRRVLSLRIFGCRQDGSEGAGTGLSEAYTEGDDRRDVCRLSHDREYSACSA